MITFFNLSYVNKEKIMRREQGQGLVEYALILVLVAIVVIAVLATLGPSIGQAYEAMVCALYGGTVAGTDTPDPYCILPNGVIGNYFDLGVPGQEGA